MMQFLSLLLSIIGLVLLAAPTRAAVWQWSVPMESVVSRETDDHPRAFLWIPPDCRRVRAVVVGQHNMEEEPILEHPRFRAAMSELGIAEVWITPPFDMWFRFDRKAGEQFEAALAALAKESGYAELAAAPIVPIGHSAAASFPWNFAAWKPQRTLAALSISGQWPFWQNKDQPVWGERTIDGVPGLVTMGEYEAAESRADEGLQQLRQHPRVPLTALAEPAGSHFNCSEAKLDFLGFYIGKACHYRLGTEANGVLRSIDPSRQGWLIDRWRGDRSPRAAAAPVGQYRGDARDAFWCFDEETAHRVEEFEAMYRGRKSDLLGYVQNGRVVPQVNGTHQQVTLPFLPIDDGLTFKLAGAFLDKVPAGRPESWTKRKAGEPVGRASSGGPITIERICGPVVKLTDDTFAIRFYRMGLNNRQRTAAIWFAADHPGDEKYRPAVQQAVLNFPLENHDGVEQHVTFPPFADPPPGTRKIPLHATCDADAKVHYYVLAGPAEAIDDTLVLTPIPKRGRLPIRVTVVAWQWGSSIEPKRKTAKAVERSFLVRTTENSTPFVHPGILHDRADLDRMKLQVARRAEPWFSGFEKLRNDHPSQADWRLRGPFDTVVRAPAVSQHIAEMDADANAAYQNALMWCITGDAAHARKSVEILNAWSSRLQSITGKDRQLGASLGGFKFVNAAELIRGTYDGWSEADIDRCGEMFRRAIYPTIKDFATFANGNWDAGCIKTMMAIGVFCDDRAIFDRAVDYYYRGKGNGRLTNYIVTVDGECQETGRDQSHTQLGLGHLADACEIGWHQHLDMYGANENRLLAGFEYTARYNLGGDVPFVNYTDTTGKYIEKRPSTKNRGALQPIYEMVLNHYENRRGLSAPFTQQAADRIRPEGPANGADHPGFGTLLFTRPKQLESVGGD